MQVTPDGDYTRTGAEWNKVGYANSVHSQHVAGPDRSGLYYFRASTASGRQFAFPWIVAPAKPTAPIAVLASNITWNAYNNFGGRSNYIHADGLPPRRQSTRERKRYSTRILPGADSTRRCRSTIEPFNHIDHPTITDPIGAARRATRRPRAARRLAGTARVRVRLLRRDALDDGRSTPRYARDRRPSRVLTRHASVKRWVFEEAGGSSTSAERPQLRGRTTHRSFDDCHNGKLKGLDVKDSVVREPVCHAARVE